MIKQKRVCAIHDISCFGKCSLTTALPIISAAGIEVSVVPTAVLSTHTGGFPEYILRDLTGDMLSIVEHWQSLKIPFDAIYTGYLASFKQLDIVSRIFDMLKSSDNLIIVDPVMADNGHLYTGFSMDFPEGMKRLVKKSDVIVPNMTEATLLLGESYHEGPYTESYVKKLLLGLSALGPKTIVLTGVYFDENRFGAACYNTEYSEPEYIMSDRIEDSYHGTGDIFASALVAGILSGMSLTSSVKIAVNFTAECIKRTSLIGSDPRYGVNFEAGLPAFIRQLGLS